MDLSGFFDVSLSLVFIFFVVSMFVSGIWEFVATIIRDQRATLLRKSIQNLVSDPRFADLIYDHPLIKAQTVRRELFFLERAFKWLLTRQRVPGSNTVVIWPSYISEDTFARVLMSLLQEHAKPALDPPPGNPLPTLPAFSTTEIQQIRQAVADFPDSAVNISSEAKIELRRILTAVLQDANSTTSAIGNIKNWYKDQMGRLTDYYKQYSQEGIRWISIVVVIAFNMDLIHVAERLKLDPELRKLVSQQAVEFVKETGDSLNMTAARRKLASASILRKFTDDSLKLVSSEKPSDSLKIKLKYLSTRKRTALDIIEKKADNLIDSLKQRREFLIGESLGIQQLPFGWAKRNILPSGSEEVDFWLIVRMIIGWILMIAAVSFGAPFWFDLLTKLVNIRNVVKEEST